MERYFSIEMPGVLFLRNVLLFSLAALAPVLVLYVLLAPGFAPALAAGGPALGRFLRQVVTNGLPVVFAVNYVSFILYALTQRPAGGHRDPAVFLLLDLVVRVFLFLGLHALIYVFSADWFGSFGSSRATALSVVAPTLARSAFFENISGVYLYATMVSALPLYVSAIKQSASLRPLVGLFPQKSGVAVLALLTLLLAVVSLTLIAELIAHLQG
jgi:hypothetical protein|mmetsp:Transcript_7468/g.12651  ORF Transcript_7468/g.12651 Transcript_7468/m.12651 type:complete len:214 (-) Transcript_7468:1935-2576(-)